MAETLISPGVLQRENDISFLAPAPLEASAAFIGPTVKGPVEIPTIVTSYSQYQRKFGVTFTSGSNPYEYFTSLAVKSFFNQGGESALITRVVPNADTFTPANSGVISSGSELAFTLTTQGSGKIYNNDGAEYPGGSLVSGSEDSIRWEVVNVDETKGTFSLIIRRGDDNHKNKIILETFNNISLDPNSPNYIEAVVGTQRKAKTVDVDGSIYIETEGEYRNGSNYVYVSSVNLKTLNYLGIDGVTPGSGSDGTPYKAYLPAASSGSFSGATGDLFGTVPANYFSEIDATDTQGLTTGSYMDAISILGNTDEYLFNMVVAPGLTYNMHANALDGIISLAESRGDAIAVIDLDGHGSSANTVKNIAASVNSSYTATYWPWLQMQSATGKDVWVPASTVLPGVYAFTDRSAAPWFAPAGLTRGGLSDVIQAERKVTTAQRNVLYAANVNAIGTFPGAGIAIFGQKTLQKKQSALDRVNVRRLLIALKKYIGDVARTLVFEQNTIQTRNRFLASVNPYLESVQQRQGLYAFRVVMDESNNTADVVDRNQLVGQIFLQPAKTVEFIILDFTIEPTGATFGA